jgi:hypothetical protein
MAENNKTLIVGGIIGFVVIILFALCWSSIEPNEYGVLYNSFTKSVKRSTVYEGGRYFLFIGQSFITFPRYSRHIEFSNHTYSSTPALDTRTMDGLNLKLHFALQYQLVK